MTKPAKTAITMRLEDLSPAARAAVEQKKLEGGWDGRSLGKLFAELDRWDTVAEARKASAQKWFIGGIIGTVIGFFAFFVVGAIFEQFLVALPFFLVPVCILILGIRKRKAARNIDLPNEIRISLRPIIRQLSQDLHPEEKVRVTMNLAGVDKSKPHGKRDLPPGRNRSLKQSMFKEPLCTIRLPLVDGSLATLRIANVYFMLERSYRTSRGKYKSKTKWKKMTTVTALLAPSQRINWEPNRIAQMIDRNNEKVSFVEKEGIMIARLDRYYKFKRAGDMPDEAAPAADILKMFIRLTAMRPQNAGGVQ